MDDENEVLLSAGLINAVDVASWESVNGDPEVHGDKPTRIVIETHPSLVFVGIYRGDVPLASLLLDVDDAAVVGKAIARGVLEAKAKAGAIRNLPDEDQSPIEDREP